MAFFKLSAPTRLYQYPFDYHSHLGGILPVRGEGTPSLTWWLDKGSPDKGERLLFDQALQFMQQSNPLGVLAARDDMANYQRAECAAENTYIACVLLAQKLCPGSGIDTLPATDVTLYYKVQSALKAVWEKKDDSLKWLPVFLRYFNGKIFSSNKYTPFDDAYKTRSAMVDRAMSQPTDGRKRYLEWIDLTLAYLLTQGIRYIQIPASKNDIPDLDARIRAFNKQNGTEYRALVHTPEGYAGGEKFKKDLESLLEFLTGDEYPVTIGLDVLGVENRVADYKTLFEFLKDKEAEISRVYGDHGKSLRMIAHIHNGEGASAGASNRSLIGYYLAYGNRKPEEGFYRAMAAYIRRCEQATLDRQAAESSGTHGAHGFKQDGVSGLFDELFTNNSLTYGGCLLKRFDINSERSRTLVAYNARRSVMALSETFDMPVEKNSPRLTWYALLTGGGSPYAFRLGHDYHFRDFMLSKYPALTFDTNLGSNAITGAAGLFSSPESYQINRGFRHLDGYIDTDVLEAATVSVAYMSSDVLDEAQIEFFATTSQIGEPIEKVLEREDVAETIQGYLEVALGPIWRKQDSDYFYRIYAELVTGVVGKTVYAPNCYQALARTYAVFRNWRSYLLGADGQGVEHSDIQNEFLRMLILLAYNLLPIGQEQLSDVTVDALQRLVLNIAAGYWHTTVAPITGEVVPLERGIASLEGYKAPASVITLQRQSAKS